MKNKIYRFKLPNWALVLTIFGIIFSTVFNSPYVFEVIICMWIVEGRFVIVGKGVGGKYKKK